MNGLLCYSFCYDMIGCSCHSDFGLTTLNCKVNLFGFDRWWVSKETVSDAVSVADVASISLNEWLIQKMSALKTLYSGQLTKSTQLIKQNVTAHTGSDFITQQAINPFLLQLYPINEWSKPFLTLISDLMHFLRTNLLVDGYCIVGLTWVDIYPREDWNFVLGESLCEDGCAVVSFGHFEPQSYQNRHLNNTASQSIAGVQCCKADKLFPQSLLKGMAIMMSFFTWNILQI